MTVILPSFCPGRLIINSLLIADRIEYRKKAEAMEIGIPGVDPAHAMFAHQYRDVQIMHQVPLQFRQFSQCQFEYRGMSLRRFQHCETGGLQQCIQKPPTVGD